MSMSPLLGALSVPHAEFIVHVGANQASKSIIVRWSSGNDALRAHGRREPVRRDYSVQRLAFRRPNADRDGTVLGYSDHCCAGGTTLVAAFESIITSVPMAGFPKRRRRGWRLEGVQRARFTGRRLHRIRGWRARRHRWRFQRRVVPTLEPASRSRHPERRRRPYRGACGPNRQQSRRLAHMSLTPALSGVTDHQT